jgi:hypothetical protein
MRLDFFKDFRSLRLSSLAHQPNLVLDQKHHITACNVNVEFHSRSTNSQHGTQTEAYQDDQRTAL